MYERKWKVSLVSLFGNREQFFYSMKNKTNADWARSSVVKSKLQ